MAHDIEALEEDNQRLREQNRRLVTERDGLHEECVRLKKRLAIGEPIETRVHDGVIENLQRHG